MSCVRQVLGEWVIEIDPSSRRTSVPPQAAQLPRPFRTAEADPDSLDALWHKFVEAVRDLCANRRGIGNAHLKHVVFASGMENLCRNVSQQTENVKLSYLEERQGRSSRQRAAVHHLVRVTRLSPIPDELRNVQFCTAEIPKPPPPPVEATRICDAESERDEGIPSVSVEILDDPVTTTIVLDSDNDDDNNDNNAASAATPSSALLPEQIPVQAVAIDEECQEDNGALATQPLVVVTATAMQSSSSNNNSASEGEEVPQANVVSLL